MGDYQKVPIDKIGDPPQLNLEDKSDLNPLLGFIEHLSNEKEAQHVDITNKDRPVPIVAQIEVKLSEHPTKNLSL